MKYVVIKGFKDRQNNLKLCKAGEEHVPQSEERAQLLLDKGFIKVVDDESSSTVELSNDDGITSVGGGYFLLPNGEKVRGREKALARLDELKAGEVNED